MNFSTPKLVADTVWQMREAERPRASDRADINHFFNGGAPWTEQQRIKLRRITNVNWLKAPKLAADGRRSYSNAFFRPARYFSVDVDIKPAHKRSVWSKIITDGLRKIMKRSRPYMELLRSQFAQTVLHGIGPVFWSDRETWCPDAVGIEDVLVPSNTQISFKNLCHFAVFRSFTPMDLYLKIHGPNPDPAWNVPLADRAWKWAMEQNQAQFGLDWAYQPEKLEEMMISDRGFASTDLVPTVDCWDFYYRTQRKKRFGWARCIILETPEAGQAGQRNPRPKENLIKSTKDEWLYYSDEIYADGHDEILHFQFGDLAAVAPFRYHNVRGLGWLMYPLLRADNRMYCAFMDAVNEAMLQYFRVGNPEDQERVQKLDLHNLGVVPEGINFVKPEERWKVDFNLTDRAFTMNQAQIQEGAAQFREGRDYSARNEAKTATQIMAEVNAANALVGSMLQLAYEYQRSQYIEICRRFCVRNSADPEVEKFRAEMLRKHVPIEALDVNRWDVIPEQVIGSGNKMLEIAQADKLFQMMPVLDPESQQVVKQIYIMANSDRADLALNLAPTSKGVVSDSVHEAQLMFGTLMQGVPMAPRRGQNSAEVIPVLLAQMQLVLQRIQQTGGPMMHEIVGLGTVGQAVTQYLQLLAQDKSAKSKVKQFGDALGQLMNSIKMLAQQMMEEKQAGGNGQGDPELAAKLQAEQAKAMAKIQNQQLSHRQRLQQRAEQHAEKLRQDQEQHEAELSKTVREVQTGIAATDLETAAKLRRDNLQSEATPKTSSP